MPVTTENQARADERLSVLLDIPAKHKGFMAAPLIGPVDAERYLATGQFEQVLCGGENYDGARPCHCEWAKGLSDQCRRHNVTFDFIETGTVFVKDGKEYRIPDKRVQQLRSLRKLNLMEFQPCARLRHFPTTHGGSFLIIYQMPSHKIGLKGFMSGLRGSMILNQGRPLND